MATNPYKTHRNLTTTGATASTGILACATGMHPGGGVQLSGTFTGTVQFEQSLDSGTTWIAKTVYPAASGAGVTSATATGQWKWANGGATNFRVRCSAFTSGPIVVDLTLTEGVDHVSGAGGTQPISGTVTITDPAYDAAADANRVMQVDSSGVVIDSSTPAQVTPGAPSDAWRYAPPAGGIDNTATAVTIKAAGGASVRNYVSTFQIQTATLGAATELAIRDGAGGTVLWRTALTTVALPLTNVILDPPIVGSLNTLLEIVTLTAVTGDVMFNAQGFTR